MILILRGRQVERRIASYVTISEAAALLRVTRQTIYNLIGRRQLRPIRLRGRRVFPVKQVMKLSQSEGGESHGADQKRTSGAGC